MPSFGDISKGGWHPKGKDGGKESWRGDFKGISQVSGWMGKGKGGSSEKEEHVSRPLATLKDPSAFGPPPKHVNYHGGAALPNQITPDRSGLGAPLSQDEIQARQREDQQSRREEEEENQPKAPSLPFRADTTGLRTSHLPPPPGRKDGADGRNLVPGVQTLTPSNFDEVVLKSGKPTFVDFYAPYCKYCKELDPVWDDLASSYESHSNIVTIAKVDVDAHKKIGVRFGIEGYPTLKYFDGKSGIPQDYMYGRDLESLSKFITQKTGALPDVVPSKSIAAPAVKAKSKPSLPPRLPPRQNSNPTSDTPLPPPTYGAAVAEPPAHRGILNQGALNRLGAAGVSVPGLGIGGKRDVLPPPQPARNGTASPTQQSAYSSPAAPAPPSRTSGAQLSELQGRFSKLGVSTKPAAEAPTEGTTFAQKQAALRTAQNFRNDPSKVSLSDARAAASTANNFRERHGEQVASGWKSANKLNTKYGLADKVGQYGGPVIGNRASPAPPPALDSPADEPVQNVIATKKAPPPPPPKKKPGLGVTADAGDGPPPIPLSSKPKPAARNSIPVRQDLDLELQTLWFAKEPMAFPPESIIKIRPAGYSMSTSSSGRTLSLVAVLRNRDDLSTTKIRVSWNHDNPAGTVKGEQRHSPPPRLLSPGELESYRVQYGDRVARWCEKKMGTQVGNGECWTLAAEALKAIAAEEQSRGKEPCLTSQSLIHGFAVYTWCPPAPDQPRGGVENAGVARGDIAQFLSCHFKKKNGGQAWAGAPDHTAVITSVERGGVLRVVESNSGGVKTVKTGTYDFSELVSGEIRIFRPVGESWVPPLDPTWS